MALNTRQRRLIDALLTAGTRIEACKAAVRQYNNAQRWDAQGPAMRETAGQDAALALVSARRRLYSLTDDDWATLPDDEQQRRLEAGIAQELAPLKARHAERAGVQAAGQLA